MNIKKLVKAVFVVNVVVAILITTTLGLVLFSSLRPAIMFWMTAVLFLPVWWITQRTFGVLLAWLVGAAVAVIDGIRGSKSV